MIPEPDKPLGTDRF